MIIISRKLVKFITFNFASAIAIYPFILLKSKDLLSNVYIINHEKIHLRQQLELLILPFYLIYFIEYLIGRIGGKNHFDAYMNISFEKEAFTNEKNLNYLKERKFFDFVKYYKN
jgi:hypothetical protein